VMTDLEKLLATSGVVILGIVGFIVLGIAFGFSYGLAATYLCGFLIGGANESWRRE